jgi:hypothetical protein
MTSSKSTNSNKKISSNSNNKNNNCCGSPRVRFENKVLVKRVDKITKESKSDVWYTRDELKSFRRACQKITKELDFFTAEELFDKYGISQTASSIRDCVKRVKRNSIFVSILEESGLLWNEEEQVAATAAAPTAGCHGCSPDRHIAMMFVNESRLSARMARARGDMMERHSMIDRRMIATMMSTIHHPTIAMAA